MLELHGGRRGEILKHLHSTFFFFLSDINDLNINKSALSLPITSQHSQHERGLDDGISLVYKNIGTFAFSDNFHRVERGGGFVLIELEEELVVLLADWQY